MGLIINNKIKKFMTGYPTVSDKYNVAGAILSGSSAVKFGDPLMWDSGTQNGDGYLRQTVSKYSHMVHAD